VVIDQCPKLVGDRVPDLLHVVESVQFPREALEHLEVGDRTNVATRGTGTVGPFGLVLLEEDGSVLSPGLSGHHRRFRTSDELAGIHRVLGPLRHADRHGDTTGGVEIRLRQAIRQAGSEPERVSRAARRHDDCEFLAAEPAHNVRGPHHVGEDLGDAHQHLVSNAVPVDVVQLLEVIDVEHEHRHGIVDTTRSR
jgi:hypothetical protein